MELLNVYKKYVNRNIDNLYLILIKQEIFLLLKKVLIIFLFYLFKILFFLIELTTIYNTLSFNDKLDREELEKFFECCDLSATNYEIQEALETVLQRKFYLFRKFLFFIF